MEENQRLLQQIKKLIKSAPPNWAELAAKELNKSPNAIYAYARGQRGLRSGMHKEVSKILKKLIEQEQAETKELLSQHI